MFTCAHSFFWTIGDKSITFCMLWHWKDWGLIPHILNLLFSMWCPTFWSVGVYIEYLRCTFVALPAMRETEHKLLKLRKLQPMFIENPLKTHINIDMARKNWAALNVSIPFLRMPMSGWMGCRVLPWSPLQILASFGRNFLNFKWHDDEHNCMFQV